MLVRLAGVIGDFTGEADIEFNSSNFPSFRDDFLPPDQGSDDEFQTEIKATTRLLHGLGKNISKERALRLDNRDMVTIRAKIEGEALPINARARELDTRSADLDVRSAELDVRSAELDVRAAQLDIRAAELDIKANELNSRLSELDMRGEDEEGEDEGGEDEGGEDEGGEDEGWEDEGWEYEGGEDEGEDEGEDAELQRRNARLTEEEEDIIEIGLLVHCLT